MKRPIVQEDDFGCGVACVAFVTEKKYDVIVKSLGKKQAQSKGFMCRELKTELVRWGYVYTLRFLKPMHKPPHIEGAIVFIKRSPRYPHGHYVAYHDGKWMDSWMNFSRDKNVKRAKSGFRKRLPGQAQYALLPVLPPT